MPYLSVEVQNLKSKKILLKKFRTSLLENCLFRVHSTALVQYQCYKMPYLSKKVQKPNLKKNLKKIMTSLLENCFLVVTKQLSSSISAKKHPNYQEKFKFSNIKKYY